MEVIGFIKKQKKFILLLFNIFVTIIFFVLFMKAYSYIHEFPHATVCELQGYESSINWENTKTNCSDINEAGIVGKIFYFMAPYFLCLIIVMFFALFGFHKKYLPLIVVPTVPILDMFNNLIHSLIYRNTDFYKLLAIENNFTIIALYIVLFFSITLIYSYKIFIPAMEKFISYIRNSHINRNSFSSHNT